MFFYFLFPHVIVSIVQNLLTIIYFNTIVLIFVLWGHFILICKNNRKIKYNIMRKIKTNTECKENEAKGGLQLQKLTHFTKI